MSTLDLDLLQAYRDRTYRQLPDLRLRSKVDAIAFVNERGFVYFWPIKGVVLPSLWAGVAGERPVADKHDDPGHITWGWKDDLLDKRQWYYAKVLRGKATVIALSVVPCFYALSENYGDPDRDYLDLYAQGRLTLAARSIYEVLLKNGPLDTVNLRREIRMTSRESNTAFERGLTDLQRDFKIVPVGVAETGAWRYSFIYELVHRYYSDLPEKARLVTQGAARRKLTQLYLDSVGAATASDVVRLFRWEPEDVDKALTALVEEGCLLAGYQVPDRSGEHWVVAAMLEAGDGS